MPTAANYLRDLTRKEYKDAAKQKAKRTGKLKKAPRILYPWAIERRYVRELSGLTQSFIREVNKVLNERVPKILSQAAENRPRIDSIRLDEYDYGNDIEGLMAFLRGRAAEYFAEATVQQMVSQVTLALSTQNKAEIGKVFREVLGVPIDPFKTEPWLAVESKAFVKKNVDLIKTIPQQFLGNIEQRVYDTASQGVSYKELQKDLKKAYQTTNSRAELIARDQVGKFNGQLTELRQTQAGLSRYIWRTALDIRVRDEHRAREGQLFEWSKPPSDGHPGQPIQCRCYAEAYLEDLLDF